jgi:hypothetical protein
VGREPTKQPRTDGGESAQPRRRFTISTVYAGFGFLTAVIGFVFLVDPALRPDPRENQAATLEAVAVDKGISFRGYAERVGEGRSEKVVNAGRAACLPGNVVYLKIGLVGFKGRQTRMRNLTFSAATRERVRGVINIPGEALRISGDVPSDQSVSLQWVQWPFLNGSFFVRFELSSGKNLLAVADTKPFKVTQHRYHKLLDRCEQQRMHGRHSEGPGFREASLKTGGDGFDTARWLLYAFALGAAGLIGAGLYSLISRLRSRRSAL